MMDLKIWYLYVPHHDEDWITLNQMIKYYKYGFGRASDCK